MEKVTQDELKLIELWARVGRKDITDEMRSDPMLVAAAETNNVIPDAVLRLIAAYKALSADPYTEAHDLGAKVQSWLHAHHVGQRMLTGNEIVALCKYGDLTVHGAIVGLLNELPVRTCNRHKDCSAVDALERQAGRTPSYNSHCHDEDCEDCFGK